MGITRINNNAAAITATRHLNASGSKLSKNIERLSSGLRINRAGDDAAGLTIRERLRTQIRGTNMAIRNAQDGISMSNTTEAALDSLVSSLQRIRELAIQAGNTGTNDAPAIQAIQDEVFQQVDEVNRIATTARFSSRILFTGDNANITETTKGQDDVGVNISTDPNASNLRSGTSILNIIRTDAGSENLLPSRKEDGQAIYATGVQNATDIAVTQFMFLDSTAAAAPTSATYTDNLSSLIFRSISTTVNTTVSVRGNDTITFQGVLSDGVTTFAGALSVGANTMSTLIQQIQTAIDNAEIALFGGDVNDIPEDFIQTNVSIVSSTSLANGAGRIRFLSETWDPNGSIPATTTTAAPSEFNISFNLIDSTGKLKSEFGSTRDYVAGQKVGAQYGNYVNGITGSTFDTGNFAIEVSDIIPPSRRTMDSTMQFRDSAGSLLTRTASLAGSVLNGTFVNNIFTTGDSGIRLSVNDTIAIQGTNANGTTFETIFTITTAAADDQALNDGKIVSLSGLIRELNYRNFSGGVNAADNQQSAFQDSVLTLTGSGTLRLIDDVADFSESSMFMIVDGTSSYVNGTNPNQQSRSLTDRTQLVVDGTPEMATISIEGGERQRVRVGDVVTLYGPEPTEFGEETPSLTMRVGGGYRDDMTESIFNQGSDTLEIVAQEYVGSLNGGPAVTFQNGDQDVFFESGVSEGVAETIMLDFDSILDITGPPQDGSSNTGMAILLSTINNALNFQVGPFKGQDLQVNIPDLRGDNIGFGRGSGMTVADINVTTVEGVNAALEIIDEALDQVSRTRSTLGAFTNRLETTIDSLSVAAENLGASESRLSDVDMASEVSDFTSNQILFQAGTSVLSQANFLPQGLLSLLG